MRIADEEAQAIIDALESQIASYIAPVSGGLIVINDTPNSAHANGIKSSIILGYGSDISERITVNASSLTSCFNYASVNNGMAVIKSTTGIQSYIATALNFYNNGIQGFMPLGSNTYVQLTLTPDSIPNIVTCGAGDTDNDTAYGNGLEFWDDDQDGNTAIDASSYSNGVILGKILKIKETLSCSWWEARYRARMTASNNGTWDIYNGYGKINITNAIAYNGSIIADPYL